MNEQFSPEEQAIIDDALKRLNNKERKLIPSQKVKQFLLAIGDEWKRTGSLDKGSVDRLVAELKAGEK